MEAKKKKISFPTAFTVLFIVLALACILTFLIPAGSYSKLQYDAGDTGANEFTLTKPDGTTEILPATQDTLKKLGVDTPIEKFTKYEKRNQKNHRYSWNLSKIREKPTRSESLSLRFC